MKNYTAIVLGASGLIGEQLVQYLLQDADCSKVRILVRRPINLSNPKLEIQVVDFDDLKNFRSSLGMGDYIFCCIGTTLKQVKSDRNAYRKVDVDLPIHAAQMGKDAKFNKFLLVSAVGADYHSKNYYLKMKGEVEHGIASLNFNTFHAFRPSILYGDRKDFRFGELLGKGAMKFISLFLVGGTSKYKGIEASSVAKAMMNTAKTNTTGMIVHHFDDMIKLAD